MRKVMGLAAALTLIGAGVLAAAAARTPADPAPTARAQQKTPTDETGTDTRRDRPRIRQQWRLDMPDGGGEIGVSIRDLDADSNATGTGAVVTDVRDDSPASKAGLKDGDVIVEFDGERVRSARHLSRLVGETVPGRAVPVVVTRDARRVTLQVTPEARETALLRHDAPNAWPFDNMPRMPRMPMDPEMRQFRFDGPGGREFRWKQDPDDQFDVFVRPGRGRLGIGIQDLTPQLAEYFGTKDGVLVSSVTVDSPASKAGLRAGDVITTIDDKPVTSPDELIDAVRDVKDGGTVKVGYVRDRKPASATATLQPRERPKRPARPV